MSSGILLSIIVSWSLCIYFTEAKTIIAEQEQSVLTRRKEANYFLSSNEMDLMNILTHSETRKDSWKRNLQDVCETHKITIASWEESEKETKVILEGDIVEILTVLDSLEIDWPGFTYAITSVQKESDRCLHTIVIRPYSLLGGFVVK